MKIAIIGSAHPLRGGGIATFNERLAEVLQAAGHDVTIYSFSLQYPSFLFPGKSQFTDEPPPKGLKIVTAINSVNPVNWLIAGKAIKNEKPDLVIIRYWLPFMGPCLGTIARIIKKNRHSHILCIADNVIPHEKRFGDAAFTRYFLKPIDSFITMSKDVLKDLKTFTAKPAQFHPHPLYDNYGPWLSKQDACRKLNLSPDGKYILFFGFIRAYKGLDLLLDAMQNDQLRALGVKLIIAGEFYDRKENYEAKIEAVKENVLLYTDFIPNEEVRYYFCAADLVVQPYRTATQSGITQTAYHFEKPMVVTNVGGLAEVVLHENTGFVVEPDAGEIAGAIARFYKDGRADRFDANIKKEKKKYSWESFIKALLSVAGR